MGGMVMYGGKWMTPIQAFGGGGNRGMAGAGGRTPLSFGMCLESMPAQAHVCK